MLDELLVELDVEVVLEELVQDVDDEVEVVEDEVVEDE